MKISTIRVEALRKFRDPFVLDALQDGINLVVAPNGGGKSTLAEAIRAAFLERHRSSKPAESLAPHSQPGASPSVQIEFTHDGKTYRVSKVFGQKKSCALEVAGKTETGEDAENHLAQLFSFGFAGKGASNPAVQGIPGLLWVQQGKSGEIDAPVEHAHEHLSRALGDAVGELVATAGDRVVERAEAELRALETATGKPTGEHARAIAQLQQASAELQRLEADMAQYEAKVDRYGASRQRLTELEARRPWEALQAELAAAQAQLQEATGLAGLRDQAALRVQMAGTEVDRSVRELAAMDDEERAAKERELALQLAVERDAETLAAVRRAGADLQAAQEADRRARERSDLARRAAERRQRQAAAASGQERVAAIDRVLEQVVKVQSQIETLEAEHGTLTRFQGAGKRLQALRDAQTQAQARLDALATRIEFDLTGDGIALDGTALTGRGSRTVVDATAITVAGIGTLRIVPGGEDLSVLRADTERKGQALERALAALGTATVQEALDAESRLGAVAAELKQLRSSAAALAPAGIDALRAERARVDGERATHAAASGAALPAEADTVGSVTDAEAAEARTKAALAAAQSQETRAREAASQAIAQKDSAQRELGHAQQRLNAPGRDARKAALQAGLVTAQAQKATEQAVLGQLEAQLLAANPKQLALDVERLQRSATAQENEYRDLRHQVGGMEGELQALGALGLGDAVSDKREEVARLEREVAARQRKARALSHLLQVLQEKRSELARRIRAPLQERLNHYIAMQDPGVQIELDEMLRPARITRRGLHGFETASFGELSGGEREQLGIIARLAYADLLRDKGKPTLLMLDDALVNTDRHRLAQMKRVLYDAAQRHQVIVFTCHEENWSDVGAAPRRLQ